jgi:hypothetical protein
LNRIPYRVALCPLFAALVVAALAQNGQAPDLSGNWKLNLSKSKPNKESKDFWETILIVSSGSNMEMQITTTRGSKSSYSYVLDGNMHVAAQMQVKDFGEFEALAKAYWKKGSLIVETSARPKNPSSSSIPLTLFVPYPRKSRYTLSTDGLTLTRDTDDPNAVFVYEKQQ